MDAAAHVKVAHHLHLAGPDSGHEVVQDFIRDRLVERAFIPVGPKIQLQGLKLNAQGIRRVCDPYGGEVRLPRLRAKAGEFRALHGDLVVPFRVGIGKCLNVFSGYSGHIFLK